MVHSKGPDEIFCAGIIDLSNKGNNIYLIYFFYLFFCIKVELGGKFTYGNGQCVQ